MDTSTLLILKEISSQEENMQEKKPSKVKETNDKMSQSKNFMQTFIIFNKGGIWHKLKAPE